ncbi:MAG: hypothetical protein IEMM0007_1544 [bacterium]|nr:MAG: hypothetical protein IEMM0007_1544 [bacterium]
MCDEKEKQCDICKIPYFERNNYFYGKLMTVRDFSAEQHYFNEKRWLINRMVNGWGVVCGLDVKPIDGETDKVLVTPGLAVDCCGREILVCEEQEVQLIPVESACRKGKEEKKQGEKKQLVICLEYHECKTEPIHLPPIACDQKEKGEFNRIRDGFNIRAMFMSECNIAGPAGNNCPLLENKLAPMHNYLCEKLKQGCPECPECPCVVLAGVTVTPSDVQGGTPTVEIDSCSRRKLVYNNPMLYDLINCFHGDLPHIVDFNWPKPKDGAMEWKDFENMMKKEGFQVTFDRDMNEKTIHDRTFLFLVKEEVSGAGYFQYRYVPSASIKYDKDSRKVTFLPTKEWHGDVFEGYSEIKKEGGVCTVVLRGDHIMDVNNKKALDGNFIGGELPSGNGSQGGDFVSWFSVKSKGQVPKPPKPEENEK